MVGGRPIRSVSAQVSRVFRTQRAHAGVVRPGLGSAKRAAQQTSLPPEGTPVQTSPSGRHRAGEERTPGVPRNAEPTSRRTVKSEGRDPLYGRRRLLAWPADRHPSSITSDSPRSSRPRRRPGRRPRRGFLDELFGCRDGASAETARPGRGDPGLLPRVGGTPDDHADGEPDTRQRHGRFPAPRGSGRGPHERVERPTRPGRRRRAEHASDTLANAS
jgi:hypothetical protein